MYSIVSIHALLLRYEAGRWALCAEPTSRNAVLCNVIDAPERGADEIIDESPECSTTHNWPNVS